jgi:erythronate-4-phosphate dehydrogenase
MRIVADDKIPFLKGVLEPFAEMVYMPGDAISGKDLLDADALLTRTRTKCNRELLEGTGVKFIGTATIGYDHIDTEYCEEKGITWKNAPGCNAGSVNQYVASALSYLLAKFHTPAKRKVLGVVGVGHVGSRVVQTAEMLGMQVYLCDPPRVREQGSCGFISMDGIIRECDIITFHVPLNREGQDKTWHMIDDAWLRKVKKGTILMNTSRGEIADTQALKRALKDRHLGALVADVWENEPGIDQELLSLCTLATPHIAGYSADGKARGTSMIVHELSQFFDLGIDGWEPLLPLPPNSNLITIDCQDKDEDWILSRLFTATYDIIKDDEMLRKSPSSFEKLRGSYPVRREFNAYIVDLVNGWPEIKRNCRKLGFKVL